MNYQHCIVWIAAVIVAGWLGACAESTQPGAIFYPSLKYAPFHLSDEWRYYSQRDKDTLFMLINGGGSFKDKDYLALRVGWALKATPIVTRYLRSDGISKVFEWKTADSSEHLVLDFGKSSPDSVERGAEYKSGNQDALTVPAGSFSNLLVTDAIAGKEGEIRQTHYAEGVGAIRICTFGGILEQSDTLVLTYARINKKAYGTP